MKASLLLTLGQATQPLISSTPSREIDLSPMDEMHKDIRAQIHATSDSYSSHLVSCDASRLLLHQQHHHQGQQRSSEAGFYQIESPPCYTIATGLPSYDEALHHQPRHFAYGMKFVYPSLAAVHHHHHHQQSACISNWEKDELQRRQKCRLSAPVEEDKAESSASASASASSSPLPLPMPSCHLAAATPAICINIPADGQQQQEEVVVVGQDQKQEQQEQQEQQQELSLQPAAAADDDCASLVVVVAA